MGEGLSDYLGFLGEAGPRTLEALVSAVTDRWPDALSRFHGIEQNTRLRETLDSATIFARRSKVTLYPCLHRDRDAIEETQLCSAKKKHRQHVRSSIRRLEQLGEFRFVALDFDADREASLRLLPALFDLHRLTNPHFSQVDHRDGRRQDFASRHAEDGDLGARGIVQIVIRGGETVARGCLVPISDTGIPV